MKFYEDFSVCLDSQSHPTLYFLSIMSVESTNPISKLDLKNKFLILYQYFQNHLIACVKGVVSKPQGTFYQKVVKMSEKSVPISEKGSFFQPYPPLKY